ncbi:hypothetical protein U1Q18_031014 [Sarracenia purpurea var. burkii]
MAKPKDSSDDAISDSSNSSEEEQINDQIDEEEDEEELEAVARTADSTDDDDDDADAGGDKSSSPDNDAGDDQEEEEDEEDEKGVDNSSIGKREKARLREMQKLKKQKIQEILNEQNAAINADMNNKGKGRLKYLLQQTEIFAHFAKGDQSTSQKKSKGRGRHASKVTEEEEDEECLKEEEDGLSGTGNTRLVAQPSCIQGKMRDYQLAGLNWLIRLYENGINGILADEMVCVGVVA